MTMHFVRTRPESRLVAQDARALTQMLTAPTRTSRGRGNVLIAGLSILLLGWAAFVPLAGGIVAPARIVVEGERKLVQHPTGGIVSQILVVEGTRVAAGAPLLRLRDTEAEALVDILGAQVDALRIEEAAILAQLSDAVEIAFADDLLSRSAEPRVASLLSTQRATLVAARSGRTAQQRELDERESQLRSEAAAAQARRDARRSQLALIDDELGVLRPLFNQGLITRPRILGLQRAQMEARGEIAALGQELLRLDAASRQVEVARQRVDVDARTAASERLRILRTELSGASDRLGAARSSLARTTLTAPVSGTVVGLGVTTIGGVVAPLATLMEIVPDGSRLVIEARVRPQDADDVRAKLPVTVRFAGLDDRRQVYLEGQLENVSADALSDQRTGEAYFRAVAAIERATLDKAGGVTLKPGLPAEMLIRTGKRTALQYLFEPLELGSFRALRN